MLRGRPLSSGLVLCEVRLEGHMAHVYHLPLFPHLLGRGIRRPPAVNMVKLKARYVFTRTTTSLSRCLLLVLTLYCPGWVYLNVYIRVTALSVCIQLFKVKVTALSGGI